VHYSFNTEMDTVFYRRGIKVVAFVWLVWGLAFTVSAQRSGTDKIYEAVEVPAEMPGGLKAFEDYVSQSLNYPTSSLRNKTQGTVMVAFVVEKNGSITNAEIKSGLDEACNNESLRIILRSPKWNPAKHNGLEVRQRLTMPITFRMPEETEASLKKAASEPSPEDTQLKRVTPELPARPEVGNEGFFSYLKQNQRYPGKARKNQVQGKVMVEFVVEKDGSLTNMKIVQKLGNGLDEEALRLIAKGPKWLPAEYNGSPIRQKMILPVVFQL